MVLCFVLLSDWARFFNISGPKRVCEKKEGHKVFSTRWLVVDGVMLCCSNWYCNGMVGEMVLGA